jgi:hypothetical protein
MQLMHRVAKGRESGRVNDRTPKTQLEEKERKGSNRTSLF